VIVNNFAPAPEALTKDPPSAGFDSIFEIIVPSGMLLSGRVLPTVGFPLIPA